MNVDVDVVDAAAVDVVDVVVVVVCFRCWTRRLWCPQPQWSTQEVGLRRSPLSPVKCSQGIAPAWEKGRDGGGVSEGWGWVQWRVGVGSVGVKVESVGDWG